MANHTGSNQPRIKRITSSSLLSDQQYEFRFSSLTTDVLTVIAERVVELKDSESQAITKDITDACDRVWHVGLLHKLILLYSLTHDSFDLIFLIYLCNARDITQPLT